MDTAIMAIPSFQKLFSRRSYPGAVDTARYAILSRIGGIYLDCDFLPCTDEYALHDVLPMIGYAALSAELFRNVTPMQVFITNSFLAAPPGHPVFETALEGLDAAMALMPKAPVWWVPGPVYLTAVSRGMLTVIDPRITKSGGGAVTLEQAGIMADEAARSGAALLAWKPWLPNAA